MSYEPREFDPESESETARRRALWQEVICTNHASNEPIGNVAC